MQPLPVEHRIGARLLAEHVEQVVGRLKGARRAWSRRLAASPVQTRRMRRPPRCCRACPAHSRANWRSTGSGMRRARRRQRATCKHDAREHARPVAERRMDECREQRHTVVRRCPYCLPPVRIHVVDPSSYTPPYDHALCGALSIADTAGGVVHQSLRLWTRGTAPTDTCATSSSTAPRWAPPAAACAWSSKLAQHVPDMLRYRRAARRADVVHFQWLAVQYLDGHLLPARRTPEGRRRPLVLTAHDVLPREPRPGQLSAQRRLYDRFDAIVVHSEHGRARLIDELGADGERIHVIPHGVFTHLAAGASERSPTSGRPVVLMFGLMRPYKGIDVLLEAWRGAGGEDPDRGAPSCWIAGMPRMDISRLQAVRARERQLRPRFRKRRGAVRLFPARRPGGAALPAGRSVGRAVHGARVRQAGTAQRRGRFSRDGEHRRRAYRASGRSACARAGAAGSCWPIGPP